MTVRDDVDAAIVAFYGSTSHDGLDAHVADLQAAIGEQLGPAFVGRPLRHVHSTLIGLDSLGPWVDVADLLGPGERQDAVRDVVEHVDRWSGWPLTLQLGGFPDRDLSVASRGQRLHDRSIAIHGRQVVLLGWPVSDDGEPSTALTDVRRELGRFGAVHRYPMDGPHGDPDAHLVIGELSEPLDESATAAFLTWARAHLLGRPHRVPVRPDDLSIVVYTDPRLPDDSTTEVEWARFRRPR